MVGGGRGSLIGPVHRMAAQLDNKIALVCGAFSADADKSRLSGEGYGLPAERVYANYEQMISAEARLPEEQRMEFVTVVTPNVSHFDIAARSLEAGFHVLSDKPATFSLAEAKQLQQIVMQSVQEFCFSHQCAKQ